MQLSNQTTASNTLDMNKFQEWINFYAKRTGIKVIFDTKMKAPAAIDLRDVKRPIVMLNPYMIKEKFNYTDEEILVDLFHELEHLKEESKMRATAGGQKIREENDKRLKDKKHLHNAFFDMQNCFRDFYVDGQMVSPENMPVLFFTLVELYRKKLFKEKNYLEIPVEDKEGNVIETKVLPKHLQFLYTILREERVKDEKCILDKKVYKIIQRLRRNGSIEKATTGKLEDRIQGMWNIEPIFQKLLEEDIENNKPPEQGESGEGESGDVEPSEGDSGKGDPSNGDSSKGKPSDGDDSDGDDSDSGDKEGKKQKKPKKGEKSETSKKNKKKSKEDDSDGDEDSESSDSDDNSDGDKDDNGDNNESGDPSSEDKGNDNDDGSDDNEDEGDDKSGESSDDDTDGENESEGSDSDDDSDGENEGESSDSDDDSDGENDGEGSDSDDEADGESDGEGSDSDDDSDGESDGEGSDSDDDSDEGGQNKGATENSTDSPKNPFDDYYNKNKLGEIMKEALKPEELEQLGEIMNNYEETKNKLKTKEELELENRAKMMGVDPEDTDAMDEITEQLQEYDNFLEQLENVEDSETKESVMDEIENLFGKIRSHRLKPRYKAKGPVDIEKGIRLHGPSLAAGIADIKSGNINPEMFEEDIKSLKELPLVGKFDLTIVGDGSGSMSGQKNTQQKIAVLLIFEALKRLYDALEEDSYKLKQGIEFNTEGLLFNGNTVDTFKNKSPDFTDKERIDAYSILDYDDGDYTNDYDAMKQILDDLRQEDDQYLQDILSGKAKKIVLVMTDGGSSNSHNLQTYIKELRELGVLVYGIGITSGGSPVITNYACEDESMGKGEVCASPEHLASVIKNILMPHLEKL